MEDRIRARRSPRGTQAVDHALRIFDQFNSSTSELSLTELSDRLGLSKSGVHAGVHALLVSLVRSDRVERDSTRNTYRLGAQLIDLAGRRLQQPLVSLGERDASTASVAAPVLGHPGKVPMALAVAGMLGRLDISASVVAVLEAARSLSAPPGGQEVRANDGPATHSRGPIAAP